MDTKKIAKNLWLCALLWAFLCFGFYVNSENYLKQKQIDQDIVRHPEKLPNPDMARISAFWFTNVMADMYWLQAIQYIGENVIGGEYKKYLWVLMWLITDLNPYFESPYVIGQLLLPSNETDGDENFSEEEMLANVIAWRDLWLKGVGNFCDMEKVERIFLENDIWKLITDTSGVYANPCSSYKVPFYLAFIYYFYLNDGVSSANYYKVVSAQKDAPEGARVLAAIMQGKWGEREKSLFMFLSLAKSVGAPTESCTLLSSELERVYTQISSQWIALEAELIREIELLSKQVLPTLSEENETEVLDDTKCTNYLAKAIREINLMYIEAANENYAKDFPEEWYARHAKILLETWYIDFLPTDYQQYPEEWYGIVYKYNEDIGRYDYIMWEYN